MIENSRTARRFFTSILAVLPLGGCSDGDSDSSAPPAGQGPGPMLPALFEGRAAPARHGVGPSPTDLGLANLDRDGTFEVEFSFLLAAEDLDGDGDVELVVTSGNRQVAYALNDGHGRFSDTLTVNLGAFAGDLELADVDADTHPDILVTQGATGGLTVFLNQL